MSLESFPEQYDKIRREIDQRMDQLSVQQTFKKDDGKVVEAQVQPLKNADTSAFQSDLDEMASIQREIQMLQLRLQQATLATKLYDLLYGKENGDGGGKGGQNDAAKKSDGPTLLSRQGEWGIFSTPTGQVFSAKIAADGQPIPETLRSADQQDKETQAARAREQEERDRAHERAVLEAEKKKKARERVDELMKARPVVASVKGVAGSHQAQILVPYQGEVTATVGSVLPNGMRVVAIDRSGVTVLDGDGRRFGLAFGSAVPADPPPAASSASMPQVQRAAAPLGDQTAAAVSGGTARPLPPIQGGF